MLLQAFPVLHFFSSQKEVFFAWIDEEKPEEKSKVKNEGKEYLPLNMNTGEEQVSKAHFTQYIAHNYASPYLEFITPPPDGI